VAWFGEGWSVGAFGLPPIPVSGASAWTAGLSGSVTRPFGDWTGGLEADFSYLVAKAPVTASQEQIDDRDSLSNPDNLDPDVADTSCGDDGCIDRFSLANFALRAGASRELGRLTPYGKLGVTRVNERLAVEYDGTEWLLRVTQPSAHLGCGLSVGERWFLGAGASVALKTAATQRGTGGPVFYKLEGAAAVRF
jgi:hypothetical protein